VHSVGFTFRLTPAREMPSDGATIGLVDVDVHLVHVENRINSAMQLGDVGAVADTHSRSVRRAGTQSQQGFRL